MYPRVRRLSLAVLTAAVLCLPASANASSIFFDQGLTPSLQSSSTGLVSGNLSTRIVASDFLVTSTVAWTDVHFWSLEQTTTAPTILQWYLFQNVTNGADADTTVVTSGSVSTFSRTQVASGVSTAGGAFYRYYYEFDLSSAYTLANGTYWLGLHLGSDATFAAKFWELNPSLSGQLTPGDAFFTVQCSAFAAGSGLCTNFSTWSQTITDKSANTAFQLTGDPVPEPATLSLLGLGLLAAGIALRKRR